MGHGNQLNLYKECCGSISRLEKLPTELIAMVFRFTVDGKHRDEWTPAQLDWERAGSPIVLSAICKRLRTIAFSTSSLWTRINLQFKRPLPVSSECALLREWVARSGKRPLSLVVHTTLYDLHSNTMLRSLRSELKSVIMTFVGRCRAIDIRGCEDYDLTPHLTNVLKMPTTLHPNLEELSLSSQPPGLYHIDLRRLPKLTSFIHPHAKYHQVILSARHFAKLRVLHMKTSAREAYEILARMPSLSELNVQIGSEGRSGQDDTFDFLLGSEGLTLSRLLNLRIMSLQDRLGVELLHKLLVPSLITFGVTIQKPTSSGISLCASIYDCLRRSRPPLERLSLAMDTSIRVFELMELLALLPTLKELELKLSMLEDGKLVNQFLERLYEHSVTIKQHPDGRTVLVRNSSSMTPPFCPNLERLAIHSANQHGLRESAAFVFSRFTKHQQLQQNRTTPMKYFELSKCRFSTLTLWDCPGIEELVRKGLYIWVDSNTNVLSVEQRS